MKKSLIIVCLLFLSICSYAGHIAGGELYYRYLGPGTAANTSKYLITLRLFRECNPPPGTGQIANLPTSVELAVYNNTNPSTVFGPRVTAGIVGGIERLSMQGNNPCITNPVAICYDVARYQTTQDLPNTAAGYIVMFQTCCRTNTILNVQKFPLSTNSEGEGATYMCQIPGINVPANNSSAVFALKDTTLVCSGYPFKLDFGATDPDADSLSYTLCGAFDRGNTVSADDKNYSSPPFNNVTYTSGFTGSNPLGPNATIDPRTGIISGIAPGSGYYVVNVCITEWRNGLPVSFHRKDFTLRVTDCAITAAQLNPSYITCNGTTLTFENRSTSSNITSYAWDFGIPSIATDVSSDPTPTYDYLQSGKDSGTYTVKLKVTSNTGCQDSTTAEVKVYPGFQSDFTVQSTCVINPYQFKDATQSRYGVVDSWRWDFGDTGSAADTARSKDSAWTYSSPRTVDVTLISTNSKGCIDTITKPVTIVDKPQLNLPFRDTLICSIDTLALQVNISNGTAAWTPQAGINQFRILNPNSTSPLVFPTDTTKYYVSVNDNGCSNTDSVTVNVLQFITVDVRDTAVCLTDTFRLEPVSHALSYVWGSSTTGEIVQNTKFPLVRPLVNTQYYVTANLGKCQASDVMNVVVEPYPVATAGPDVTICYGTRTQLSGTIMGNSFYWSPTASLRNENTLTPTAGPVRTTQYILTANNHTGCLKPKSDTVVVTVIPPIIAYAGRDTVISAGQPLQLEASGGVNYVWTPSIGLSNTLIYNPIATLDAAIDSITYTVRASEAGCFAEDQVTVRVFKTGADILVPSAFTPNGDGRNDAIKPFTVGITTLTHFSIYNRWGQLLFMTSQIGKAWDGTYGGIAQPPGTYVYQALGVDYRGNNIFRKGTIVLIR